MLADIARFSWRRNAVAIPTGSVAGVWRAAGVFRADGTHGAPCRLRSAVQGSTAHLERPRRATRGLRASTAKARLAAVEAAALVEQCVCPFALFARFGIRQWRPVGYRGFWPSSVVPGRHANIEIAGAVRPVGPGRELVDGRCVDGVLALLGALPVAFVAATPAEKIAFEPFPVRAAPASAFCGKCRPSSATTGGPSIQTRLARFRRGPVLLAGHWFSTPPLHTLCGVERYVEFLAVVPFQSVTWASFTPHKI